MKKETYIPPFEIQTHSPCKEQKEGKPYETLVKCTQKYIDNNN